MARNTKEALLMIRDAGSGRLRGRVLKFILGSGKPGSRTERGRCGNRVGKRRPAFGEMVSLYLSNKLTFFLK